MFELVHWPLFIQYLGGGGGGGGNCTVHKVIRVYSVLSIRLYAALQRNHIIVLHALSLISKWSYVTLKERQPLTAIIEEYRDDIKSRTQATINDLCKNK